MTIAATSLLDSIVLVSGVVGDTSQAQLRLAKVGIHNRSIVESIELISKTYAIDWIEKQQKRQNTRLTNSVMDTSYAAFKMLQKRLPECPGNLRPTLTHIGQAANENTHSDYVAALLNEEVVGIFARRFLTSLMNYKCGEKTELGSGGVVRAFREMQLRSLSDDIQPPIKHADMRIDILARCGRNVLVIENKLYTSEHGSQTKKYYSHCRNVFDGFRDRYLFLSPSGVPAESEHFKAIDYLELYRLAASCFQPNDSHQKNSHLIQQYLNELAALFLEPLHIYLSGLRSQFKAKGMNDVS